MNRNIYKANYVQVLEMVSVFHFFKWEMAQWVTVHPVIAWIAASLMLLLEKGKLAPASWSQFL